MVNPLICFHTVLIFNQLYIVYIPSLDIWFTPPIFVPTSNNITYYLMKTFTTILFLSIVFSTMNATTPNSSKEIEHSIALTSNDVENEINNANTRNLPSIPIQVFLEDRNLCIESYSVCSYLNIILLKDGIEVENRALSIEKGQYEVIDLSEYESGIYQIVLSTAPDTMLYGVFTL